MFIQNETMPNIGATQLQPQHNTHLRERIIACGTSWWTTNTRNATINIVCVCERVCTESSRTQPTRSWTSSATICFFSHELSARLFAILFHTNLLSRINFDRFGRLLFLFSCVTYKFHKFNTDAGDLFRSPVFLLSIIYSRNVRCHLTISDSNTIEFRSARPTHKRHWIPIHSVAATKYCRRLITNRRWFSYEFCVEPREHQQWTHNNEVKIRATPLTGD